MRLLTLTFFVLVLRQAIAQHTGVKPVVLSLNGGAFFSTHPGRNVIETFPYTSTPSGTGVTSSQTFFGTLGGDFPRIGYVGDLINLEFPRKHHAINSGIGLYPDVGSNDGGYFKAGYRWVLPFLKN